MQRMAVPAETAEELPVTAPVPTLSAVLPEVGQGTIEAWRTISVYSRLAQQVVASHAREGCFVREGELLFQLDREELDDRLLRLKATLDEKEVSVRDILIGQGYDWENTAGIPEKKLELARVKSGYNSTRVEYEIAQKELRNTEIVAPASGFVSQLKLYPNDYATTAEPACRIVCVDKLNLIFYVLEQELVRIKVGDKVSFSPVANASKHYRATVTLVMPQVDANGMIRIKARVEDPEGLLPGMHVIVNR